MKKIAIVVCTAVLIFIPKRVQSQQVIVNELYNSSGSDEWVELVVLQDSLDMRNWDLRDFSSGGVAQKPLQFTTSSLWSSLRKGTVILVGTSATTFTEDTDPSDYLLVIKASNSLYFNSTGSFGVFSFAATSDAIQIRNSSGTHIFGVAWGASNSASLPSPQVYFSGTMSSSRTIFYNDSTISGLTNTASWSFNSSTQTPGAGNTVTNAAWLSRLHANADGSGRATVSPDTLIHGTTQTLVVDFYRDTAFVITDMRIVLPSNFVWSQSAVDVSPSGISATTTVSGDTIYLNGISMGADSGTISIQNVTAPDSTAIYPVVVATKSVSAYGEISPEPEVVVFGNPVTIDQVKVNDANGLPLRIGQLVTIRGIVTVANEFGGPSYVQDNTAGIAVFGSNFSTSVNRGDEVILSGIISPFNGLNELGSLTLHQVVSTGNTVDPVVLTCTQVNGDGAGGIENYEGLLVRIDGTVVRDIVTGNTIPQWTVSSSGTNYRLGLGSDTLEVRVDNNVDFAGTSAPQSTFDIIGVVSQFKSSSPFIGGYQLMPRSMPDIIASGPIIGTIPVESNLTPTSFRVSWTTLNNGTSRLRYGTTTAYELGVLAPDNVMSTSHAVDVTGLQAATIYHVQAFSVGSVSDTSLAGDLVVSTSSPLTSSGVIHVYFNRNIDTSVAQGEKALGNQDLVSLILNRINNATHSIDAALYSLSGSAQGNVVANALVSAKNRGVKVRVICEHDNASYSGFNIVRSNGIPIIDDTYDAVWDGAGLMHNKFFVFDYRGGAPESVWVWGGSWNPTFEGTTEDRQNSIEIQDAALAGAYTTKFNEMWGSSGDAPNASTSRFGARESDITPHNFVIGGIPISCYFSPSDQTTMHIRTTIAKAQHSVSTCILTFTRQDIADSIISRKNAGRKTRVVMDNNTDSGNQYAYLQSKGVDVHLKGFSNGLLHHKYTVIDGDQVTGSPILLTGSHNYSSAAENSNDENTLIIQDRRIANLYLQEFTARYYEAGGTDSFHVSSSALFSASKSSINFDTVAAGGSKKDSFVVNNTGNLSLIIAPLTITNARFSASPESATVPSLGSQKFYITFSPTGTGPQSGFVILSHNAPGSPDSVSVLGVGAGSPTFSAGVSTLNFDTVLTNQSKLDSISVSNPGNASLHISSVVATNPDFSVLPDSANIPASGSAKFYVTFSPSVVGSRTGLVVFTHNAATVHDTIHLQGVGKYPSTVNKILSLLGDWNMVSLPVNVVDGRRTTLFPNSTSKAFGYQGGYVQKDSLENGKGYWLKFGTAQSDTVNGLPTLADSIPVAVRWNMIGSVTSPVAVSSVISAPAGIVQSNYFGFNGTYAIADTIFPGKAYWVKTNQAGLLVLASSTQTPKALPTAVPQGISQLTFSDASGHVQTLMFGAKTDSLVSVERFELPPPPPAGAFDVRFSSDKYAEFHEKVLRQSSDFTISLQASKYPVKISWAIATDRFNYYTLAMSRGGQTTSSRLTGHGEMTVDIATSSSLVLTASPVRLIPERYALEQNYPNPFNPVTRIPFGVPQRSVVTLKVYNEVGQVVRTLVSQETYDAGFYEITADASQLASGVYYYVLTAVSVDKSPSTFHQVKKMLVLK